MFIQNTQQMESSHRPLYQTNSIRHIDNHCRWPAEMFEKLPGTIARASDSSPQPSRSHRYAYRYPRSSSPWLLMRLIQIRTSWTGINEGSIMYNSHANILFSLGPLIVDDLLTMSLDKFILILFGRVVYNNKGQCSGQNQCDRNQ